jgi:hypothetical protein
VLWVENVRVKSQEEQFMSGMGNSGVLGRKDWLLLHDTARRGFVEGCG